MKQRKRYEDALRTELVRQGIYQDKNEELLKCAARCQWFIDMLEDDLKGHSLLLHQNGSMGQTKIQQHPHVESIRKYNHTLAFCLARLGFGNDTDNENEKNNEFEQFLRDIQL